MREDSEGRLAEEVQEREKRGHVHQMGILTVDASGAAARQEIKTILANMVKPHLY